MWWAEFPVPTAGEQSAIRPFEDLPIAVLFDHPHDVPPESFDPGEYA